jgi:hypothetical protein
VTLSLSSYRELFTVNRVRRHIGCQSYIQGSTGIHENDGKEINLGRMPYWVYAGLGEHHTG